MVEDKKRENKEWEIKIESKNKKIKKLLHKINSNHLLRNALNPRNAW